MDFPLHDVDSAPENSPALLEAVARKFGFTPNLTRILAESPVALETYLTLNRLVESSSLTPGEQQVAILATSVENRCTYCVAAHSAVAAMVGLPQEVLHALREGGDLPDPKLNALALFTRGVVRGRGHVEAAGVRGFLDAGFSRRQLLEVLVAVTLKTLSNYTNHLAETPLDGEFSAQAWAPGATAGV